jgi:4-aminobutyrate aminotransferase
MEGAAEMPPELMADMLQPARRPVTSEAGTIELNPRFAEGDPMRVAGLGERYDTASMERIPEQWLRFQQRLGDVRGRGLLIGIELVRDRATKEPDAALAERVLYRALAGGLSFKTTMGNVLTLTPPLTIGAGDMLVALGILEEAIAAA